MKRSDVHRPSAINTADYEFVAFNHVKIESIGDCFYAQEQRARLAAHMARTGGERSTHAHGGNCMICGNANAIYTAMFYHAISNTYVRVGQDCAEKIEMSCGDWNAFRAAIGNALEAKAGKAKAAALLADAGISQAFDLFIADAQFHPACEWHKAVDPAEGTRPCTCWKTRKDERTVVDIVSKIVKYGNMSDAQANFMRTLLARIADKPALEAKRAEENAAAANCPNGRATITGTVLSLRVDESDFGTVTKILVRDDSGFKVWGSRPGYTNVERGDRLSFSAAVTPSNDDPKFGFYKRPTKAVVLTRAEETVSA